MSSNKSYGINQLSLSRFAYNIYSTINLGQSYDSGSPQSSVNSQSSRPTDQWGVPQVYKNQLIYSCERDVTCISQLKQGAGGAKSFDDFGGNHLILGGKNLLKLCLVDNDQTRVVQEINVLDQEGLVGSSGRFSTGKKLHNVNTIESVNDLVISGLSNGVITVYKINNNGSCHLVQTYSDHKRCINSLDFIDRLNLGRNQPSQIMSGSQDGTIKIWDLRVGSYKSSINLTSGSHSDPVRSCESSPHSAVRNKISILSVHDSGTLCKFDVRHPHNGHRLSFNPEKKWNYHTGPALSLHLHPEKEYVLTGGRDQKVCVWNYSESNTNANKMIPEHIVNTYGPVMKLRWCPYSSYSSFDSHSFDEDTDNSNHEFNRGDDRYGHHDRDAFSNTNHRQNSLYDYDFACLYLNDDPTITTYNLRRKFIPREIITSASGKPFQNFIWSLNDSHSRRIWSVTKSNLFVSYDLNSSSFDNSIMNPLDNFGNITTSWNTGMADLCIVGQDKSDYESSSIVENDTTDSGTTIHTDYGIDLAIGLDENDTVNDYNIALDEPQEELWSKSRTLSSNNMVPLASSTIPSSFKSVPIASNSFVTQSHNLTGPMNRPFSQMDALQRHPHLSSSSSPVSLYDRTSPTSHPKHLNALNSLIDGSPTIPHTNMPVGLSIGRPALKRNVSQSTQGSFNSLGSTSAPQQGQSKKAIPVTYMSPFIIPISLPITLNDEASFEILSSNYLMTSPDGFDIINTCLFNSKVAESARKFRDCQIWKVLATCLSIEQSSFHGGNNNDDGNLHQNNDTLNDSQGLLQGQKLTSEKDEVRSITSELGNVVGSFNSNSTLNTNYPPYSNENQELRRSTSDTESGLHDTSYKTPGEKEPRESFSNVLSDSKQIRRRSFYLSGNSGLNRSNSMVFSQSYKGGNLINPDTEVAIEEVDSTSYPEKGNSSEIPAEIITIPRRRSFHILGNSRKEFSHVAEDGANERSLNDANKLTVTVSDGDLDAEKSSGTKSKKFKESRTPGIMSENFYKKATPSDTMNSELFSGQLVQGGEKHSHSISNMVTFEEEKSKQTTCEGGSQIENVTAPKPGSKEGSKLTVGMGEYHKQGESNAGLKEPWKLKNLLEKAFDYALQNGDIIMCSVLSILFYDYSIKEDIESMYSKECLLELLGQYIEILRRKQFFAIAVNTIKCAPEPIRYDLANFAVKNVSLRFYCCWCGKLLINEKSKLNSNHGYWYCENCSKRQTNCVYCNEPCKGLNVVTTLRCGHRGHYGCLKEWFLEEENVECPGCDEVVI